MKLVGIWKSNECMNTCAEHTVTIILEVYKLSRKSVYYNNTQWGGWVVLYVWAFSSVMDSRRSTVKKNHRIQEYTVATGKEEFRESWGFTRSEWGRQEVKQKR